MVGDRAAAPWCIVFLVVGALVSHSMVLFGNLATSRMLHGMGSSTNGWSVVGTGFAHSLNTDLEPAMHQVASHLTETIEVVTQLQKSTDLVLSSSGSDVDGSLAELKGSADSKDLKHFKEKLMAKVTRTTHELMQQVQPLIDKFLELLKPALEQVREWLKTFGDKIQVALEQFGTTVDKVQKIFDQVLAKLSTGTGKNLDYMVYNTFTLFDTDGSGLVKVDDLQNIANIYGISALQGQKSQQLLQRYDRGGDSALDKEEFAKFVSDPDVPGLVTVVLRTYSRKLADIGGMVGSAKFRDEVAGSVVDYFSLVCAKNRSRVDWVAQALTNGSLPLPFTADVMKELVMADANPNSLSVVRVGPTVLSAMVGFDAERVGKAMTLLGNASFWAAEGFDGRDQPDVLGRLAGWLAEIDAGPTILEKSLGLTDVDSANKESMTREGYRFAQEQQNRFQAKHSEGQASDQSSLYKSSCSQVLRDTLLGGSGAAAAGADGGAEQTARSGQEALPETLEFAKWLANNATDTAHRHLHECFDFNGQSSGAIESFANQVNGMLSKTKNFLHLMSNYASQRGIDRLVEEAQGFGHDAESDVLQVCEEYVDSRIAAFQCEFLDDVPCNTTAASPEWIKNGAEGLNRELNGAFSFIMDTATDFKTVLPPVIKDLKFARKSVSSMSNTLNSVMTVLGAKAPPMFYKISSIYKTVWIAYFFFFGTTTLLTLFYAFWASGYFGGPQASEEQTYEAPQTMRDRLRTCFASCGACLRGCHDSHLGFWSAVMLAEVFVLMLFLISIVIVVVGGVQAFLSAGCSQVYILGDETICTTAMNVLRTFLKTFGVGDMAVGEICQREQLMTCKLIAEEAGNALVMSIIGSIVATLLSCQMIVESAIMHEKARLARVLEKSK